MNAGDDCPNWPTLPPAQKFGFTVESVSSGELTAWFLGEYHVQAICGVYNDVGCVLIADGEMPFEIWRKMVAWSSCEHYKYMG